MATNDIGIDARTIWQLLQDNGKLTLLEIKELTHYKDFLIHSAIGWLSRDGKIQFSHKEDGTLCIEAKTVFSEQYY